VLLTASLVKVTESEMSSTVTGGWVLPDVCFHPCDNQTQLLCLCSSSQRPGPLSSAKAGLLVRSKISIIVSIMCLNVGTSTRSRLLQSPTFIVHVHFTGPEPQINWLAAKGIQIQKKNPKTPQSPWSCHLEL
jgi:hypothetical protein